MALYDFYDDLTARLRASGEWVWPFLLRAILFWEFWESGKAKLNGENWFGDIPWADWQVGFPFPFSALSTDLNWFFATWGELVFAVMLLLGLFTRFVAFSLLVITAVAMVAVHWPNEWSSLSELWEGYAISASSSGNFKLALLFMIMLLPLVFHGGGRFSLDQVLVLFTGRTDETREYISDMNAAGLAFLILGVATVFAIPTVGYVFLGLAAMMFALSKFLYK